MNLRAQDRDLQKWVLRRILKLGTCFETPSLLKSLPISTLVQTRYIGKRPANKKWHGNSTRSARTGKVRLWRNSTMSHRSPIVELCLLLTAIAATMLV